ncbi:uncharacterized protein LOC117182999 [Belonocnema kinseyi]|uniref:uncharacterized protein LOC117182999 n=1 Tax=Belonocnema kinseyi TaxID=2817044 RepID=UPI00143D4224|nr:uncharacterized protein LOC117182999 [Belonocnema kinseyi]
MRRDIGNWLKQCTACQQSTISRYNQLFPADFMARDCRFRHVHMDSVGPLPLSKGFRYCLTMFDRFSRCPEAVFKALLQLIGCNRIPTTAHHPAANKIIKRWHRCLSAAIMCHTDKEWSQTVSTVLLGLRSNVLDIGSSPADFVFGTTLRIPGELVLPEDFAPDPPMFIAEFREHMRKIKPIPVGHKYKRKPFLFKDLTVCSHAFMRNHAKKYLERPCTSPHKVISRTSDRVYKVDVNGTKREVSIEHLKLAYFMREDIESIFQFKENLLTERV